MSAPKPEQQQVSIVVLGSFNPGIFHPSWFARHGLIRPEEEKDCRTEIVHPQVSAFQLGAFRVFVDDGRFQVASAPEHMQPLRDLVHGVFALLAHCPIKSVGFNRLMHFPMTSEDAWNEVGYGIVPAAPWIDVLRTSGLTSVTVEGPAEDEEAGYMHISVAPSRVIKNGVLVSTNEHFDIESGEASALSKLLSERWNKAQHYALSASQLLIRNARESPDAA